MTNSHGTGHSDSFDTEFDTEIVTEYDPRFWGYETEEEWDIATKSGATARQACAGARTAWQVLAGGKRGREGLMGRSGKLLPARHRPMAPSDPSPTRRRCTAHSTRTGKRL